MIWIGIDPGLSGGIAAILESAERPRPGLGVVVRTERFSCWQTPTLALEKGRRAYDVPRMIGILQAIFVEGPATAILEHVGAMPGQGVVSMFRFGEGFGLWQGILAALGIPFELVRPNRWKAQMLSGRGRAKGESVALAGQLFPGFTGKDGPAEALLLAEWGRRNIDPRGER